MQLEDFILYLDENLDNCAPILDALTQGQVRYERHRTYFQRGTDDDVWLPFVASRGWVVLTKDKRNRYNDLEREAIRRGRVREFYFSAGNMNGAEMAKALMLAVEDLRRIARQYSPPVVGSITRSGAVTVLYDEKGSTHERRKAKLVKGTDAV